MQRPPNPRRDLADKLRDRIALSLVLDDTLAAELTRKAEALEANGDHEGARALIAAARRHRVGAIKQRALLSASGIAV